MTNRMEFDSDTMGSDLVTVHLVFNAHIDPVWLWPWQSGADEVVATCRSACDRLESHPDLIFTKGEAWTYDVIERLDPALFQRIRRHQVEGRWEIVGGWWIQPDCNQPSGEGMRKQIALGKSYFESRFGSFPRVAYNVDSFGHAAALPRLLRAHGQDRYVMMRPQEHECALPARLFRWRGYDDDPDVVTFRIAGNYETSRPVTVDHILAALEGLPSGVRHTMCFVGVGDHGGGPTERQIDWCRAHANSIPGCRLVFSSPSRFFDAVKDASLPLVTGELQHHAVGCYSVMRSIKLGVRDAEHRLRQAEIVAALDPATQGDAGERLQQGWRYVCFNHFHDAIGGTCIPSAYPQLDDQLGAAKTIADEILQFGFRRRLPGLPDDLRQRIVLLNASDGPFRGYVVLAPWTEEMWQPHWRLIAPSGAEVHYQIIEQEALARHSPRIVLRVALKAGELMALALERRPVAVHAAGKRAHTQNNGGTLVVGAVGVEFTDGPAVQLGRCVLKPDLVSIEDPTGTWAHGVDRFGDVATRAIWGAPQPVHAGPLMSSTVQRGQLGRSDLLADWRVFAEEELVHLTLRVHWHALYQVLKLILPFSVDIEDRVDGVLDGTLNRGQERRERPLRDLTLVRLKSGLLVGVVCPDVFAIDAGQRALRFTLLRSPFMAHHHPSHPATPPHAVPADQGPHTFRFEFMAGEGLDVSFLEGRALALHRPPLMSDWTKGMVSRSPD
jgi:alpha-mannosidase